MDKWIGLIALGFFAAFLLAIVLSAVPAYLRARIRGLPTTFFDLVGMRFRKTSPNVIVTAAVIAKEHDLDVTTKDLENQLLAGGDPVALVKALAIAGSRGGNGSDLFACDLAGYDVLALVEAGYALNGGFIGSPESANLPDRFRKAKG